MRIEKVRSELAQIERKRTAFLRAIAVYERCEAEPLGEFPESAYRAYIITGAVEDAAKMLNDAGQRNGNRKFQSNDISAIIDSAEIEDKELMYVAKFLLSGGRYFMDKLFN